ncbi:MAG: A/G-specific adenine glycosylase [Dysgonomonas sp.]|nr:A/G-specific adenine glycosylase [Dysgonomonas sp.]
MNNKKDLRLSSILTTWYEGNKRNLPWRHTKEPYLIWLSEIILQQTRVDQGLSYYNKFAERYPSVDKLAEADEFDVLKLWQGLGYYSRARNLHAASKMIMDEYKGVFPSDYKNVLKLKGVGEYTAAAIVSFSYNKPYAVVDGNVFRVLARIFAIDTPINTTKGRKLFTELADELLDEENPGLHNQAIMEFGALQCVPVSPNCSVCPAQSMCMASAQNKVQAYPKKEGKQKIRERYFYYFDIRSQGKMLLHKRTAKDIWQNLYELPLIESSEKLLLEQLPIDYIIKDEQREGLYIKEARSLKHILSHQIIYASFYQVEIDALPVMEDYIIIDEADLDDYPVSRLVNKYLSE